MLSSLPPIKDSRVLSGGNYIDDGAVFKIRDDLTLVQTVDFFPPVVDDPYDFGEISVANAVSDIYAMGGIPITALNVVGFPEKLDISVLGDILKGAMHKAEEAEMLILGGHSVRDKEVKFGLAVTGILPSKHFTPTWGAKEGDVLVLTKPIGNGIITTGIKYGIVEEDVAFEVVKSMKQLNKVASHLMIKYGANASTDITGFGLLGHAQRMAYSSGVSLIIQAYKVPLFKGVYKILSEGAYPGGSSSNRVFVEKHTHWAKSIDEDLRKILCDAQTSGGLLISISRDKAEPFMNELKEQGITPSLIGEVVPKRDKYIYVE